MGPKVILITYLTGHISERQYGEGEFFFFLCSCKHQCPEILVSLPCQGLAHIRKDVS